MSFWEGPSNCILVHKLKDVKGGNSLLAGKSTSFSNYVYPRRFQVKEMWFQNKTEKKSHKTDSRNRNSGGGVAPVN